MTMMRAQNTETLSSILGATGQQIEFIAGGTDLIIARREQHWAPLIIDISQTKGLTEVALTDTHLRIGAAVSMHTLTQHSAIQGHAPLLSQAAASVGSDQIRNRATIGGNIASAMPAADLMPALMCLDAEVEILRRNGTRETQAIDQVVLGRGQTSLQNGDLIVAIHLPLEKTTGHVAGFAKLGPREVLTIARLSLAALTEYDADTNTLRHMRLAAGALGPMATRLPEIEALCQGRQVNQSLADDFLNALAATVDQAIPGRASLPYKRRAVLGVGLDLLQTMFGQVFACTTLQERLA